MFLLQQKVLMEKRTVPSILKTIVERESLKGRKKVSTFFHLKFGHVSLNKFASCENCELAFLWNVSREHWFSLRLRYTFWSRKHQTSVG